MFSPARIMVFFMVAACGAGPDEDAPAIGERAFAIHSSHSGPAPWPHVLTCYGGCSAPHYDPSACNHHTSCGPIADGTWWYATERAAFYCGARLKLQRGDRCVVVDVQDNGPADWVEDNAAARCGVGYIIDTSPLVADYFGGGCGWGECFIVNVSQVPDGTPTGPTSCTSCQCTPGETGRRGCGNCGTQTRTCRSDCQWGAWSTCTGQGPCSPGAVDSRACCDCGSQSRTCRSNCEWGDWGGCAGPDPDGGTQVCDTGECGPCGEGRMRCVEGCLQCVRVHDPVDETCDDADNDCNCSVDDGYPQVMGDPPPRFSARLVDLSYAAVVKPGRVETVWAQFENTGTEPWLPREIMLAPAGTLEGEPSRLDPDGLWPAWDVADLVEDTVEPGRTALLSFPVTVPLDASGEIDEIFVLLGPDGGSMKCPMPDLALSMMVGSDGKADEGAGSGSTDQEGLAAGCACSLVLR
jgi:hypothetical protein